MSENWRPPPIPWPVRKRPPSRRRRQDCMDCGIDTSFATGNGHYYMVRDEVWLKAVPDRHGLLCLDCLQARLSRPLTDEDFLITPLEMFRHPFGFLRERE